MDKAGVEFPTLIDNKNILGRSYGFKAVPNCFLIDELGFVQYKELGGFDIRKPGSMNVLTKWAQGLGSPQTYHVDGSALMTESLDSNDYFEKGVTLYHQGLVEQALIQWRRGAQLDPGNYIIRKQIWAVENPDKFYAGKVDYDWQKEQITAGL